MNQRRGKTHRASGSEQNQMGLVSFLKEARLQLSPENPDAAFYFEQVEEHLRSGKELSSNPREVAKILGL